LNWKLITALLYAFIATENVMQWPRGDFYHRLGALECQK